MAFDPVLLSRLQFAFVVSFHIIFPAFTIGLAAWLATIEGVRLVTGNPVYRRVFDFWLRVFALSFGMGAHPCNWFDACGHRLALFFRRSLRRATNRRRICGRPVGVRSCGARAPDYRRRFPAFAGHVSDSRPGARHWRMGASQS
jgi:hypothetical protein